MKSHGFLLSLPSLVIIALFLGVLASFASVSFLVLDPGGAVFHGPATLVNYTRLIHSAATWSIVLSTVDLAIKVTLLCILFGYPLALVLARSRSRHLRRIILFCLVATFLSGGVTRAYAWLIILGNNGVINKALHEFGLPRLAMINNEFAVVVSVLNFVLPFFVLTLFGALRAIPESLEHAARNLGASRARTLVHITLPLSFPGLTAATTLCFAMTLAAFLFPQMLGGGRVQVLATAIYERIQASYDIPAAAAMAILFFALVVLTVVVIQGLRAVIGKRYNGGVS